MISKHPPPSPVSSPLQPLPKEQPQPQEMFRSLTFLKSHNDSTSLCGDVSEVGVVGVTNELTIPDHVFRPRSTSTNESFRIVADETPTTTTIMTTSTTTTTFIQDSVGVGVGIIPVGNAETDNDSGLLCDNDDDSCSSNIHNNNKGTFVRRLTEDLTKFLLCDRNNFLCGSSLGLQSNSSSSTLNNMTNNNNNGNNTPSDGSWSVRCCHWSCQSWTVDSPDYLCASTGRDIERVRQHLEKDISLLMSLPAHQSKIWIDALYHWLMCSSGSSSSNDKVKESLKEIDLQAMLYRNRSKMMHATDRKMQRLRQMHFQHPPHSTRRGVQGHTPHQDNHHTLTMTTATSMDNNGGVTSQIRNCKSSDHAQSHPHIPSPSQAYKTQTIPFEKKTRRRRSAESSVSKILVQTLSGECDDGDDDDDDNPLNKHNSNHQGFENDDDVLCYDSDPGIYTRQPRVFATTDIPDSTKDKPPNNPLVNLITTPFIHNGNDDNSNDDDDNDIHTEADEFLTVYNPRRVSAIIQELTNENTTLVWHPSKRQRSVYQSPLCVQAWFEMGSRLKDRVIQPKFMWRPAFENNNSTSSLSHNVPFRVSKPYNIELLNIVRVLKPDRIDREQYPFVKLANSFVIHNNTDDTYLFESTSRSHCDKFVHGLKLVVARLASKIIVGDERVFDEFFTPWGLSIAQSASQISVSFDNSVQTEGGIDSIDSNESDFGELPVVRVGVVNHHHHTDTFDSEDLV